jgi:DNA (cytosine-5)-methyltransferase 3A
MNVLSLFDGMSCGQIALKELGIKVDKYYASEIDKYAIQIAQKNFPDTIHVGDVTKVSAADFPKIDLLLGGSPCQGFSFSGKQLNFSDPRSALFFEYVRLLKELRPKYFLLENVRMKQEYQDVISKHLGVKPIMINSALVSAQNRNRLYWTNIPNITQPKDRGIILKDILENGIATDEMTTNKKSFCLTARYQGAVAWNSIERRQRTMVQNEYTEPYVKLNGKKGGCVGYVGNKPAQATRIYSVNEKSQSLMANGGGQGGKTGLYQIPINKELHYRKLTPIECSRLQTVPDGYCDGVSNTQQYKMLGNGWTVEVIKHILNNMEVTS